MEIKKGISQMPEFLNQEINYVVPNDGKMYYVLKDGVLEDGTVIATLDPKYAFDQTIPCSTVGAFKEDGSILIDFDKKEIKRIGDDLLLVVSSNPSSNEVLDALAKEHDDFSRNMILDNTATITDKLINEMGITGEMLFSNAFSEANVYRTDSYNNKVGIDCSFIGKTNKELYFHTNDVNSESKIVSLNFDASNNNSNNISDIPTIEEISTTPDKNESVVSEVTDVDSGDELVGGFKLDIDQDILNGFNTPDTLPINQEKEEVIGNPPVVSEEPVMDEEIIEKTSDDIEKEMNETSFEPTSADNSVNDEVLDNAIAVMKKMIEETNKLNERINNLEKEIQEKDKTIEKQESKKSVLNNLLDQANEVLEKID